MSKSFAIAVALFSVSLSACAVTQELGLTQGPAAARGRMFAERQCSSCHAIDRSSESSNPSARPFRDIRARYNARSLRREFDAITEVGHYQMPPTPIGAAEGLDLIAYFESLGQR